MSQERLARSLGLPLGVLRAYETGAARIGADVLYSICRMFGLRPAAFFEGQRSRAPLLAEIARPLRASAGGCAPFFAPVMNGVVSATEIRHDGIREKLVFTAANNSADRRVARRRACRLEVAVQYKGRRSSAVVEDISVTGVRLADRLGLATGEALRIDLGGDWIAGRVVWAAKGRAGLQFESPLKTLA